MKILKPKFWDKKELSLFSIILLPFSFLYEFLLSFKKNLTKKKGFSIPIICVGNIYIGGTGKTPVSIKIFEILKKLKMKPVIIKKNYTDQIDEILLIKKYSKIITSTKRKDAIEEAIQKKFNIIIMDDGFQDFTIKKNINIICFNSTQKIGNGFTVPAGPLRHSLRSLRSCHAIFINGGKDTEFEIKLKQYNKNIEFIYYDYIPENISEFKNDKLIAFAGIGNPENFFKLIESYDLNLLKKIKYPDHYNYNNSDLDYLIDLKKKNKARLVTTEKDYMRLNDNYRENFDFISVKIDLKNSNLFNALLEKKLYESN